MGKSIPEAFADFHAANPHVYDELVAMARQARSEGAQKIGMRTLWEVLRWRHKAYLRAEDPSQDAYRLNDHYPPHYARMIMERESDLAGMFETRHLRAHGDNPLYSDAQGNLTLFENAA